MFGDSLVRISSEDRTSGSSTDFRIVTRDMRGTWELQSVLLPNAHYNINSTNNTILITIASMASGVTITITNGFYTGSTLATEATSKINAYGSFSGVSATYSSITGKISLSHSSNNITVTLANGLGFTSTSSTSTTVTGDSIISLGINSYRIFIDDCDSEFRDGCSFSVANNVNTMEYIY